MLAEIVARKRTDVAARLAGAASPICARRRRRPRAACAPLWPGPGARFVMEVKKASPSAGALGRGRRRRAGARPMRGAADAVSVLTDAPYFGGSLDDLRGGARGL